MVPPPVPNPLAASAGATDDDELSAAAAAAATAEQAGGSRPLDGTASPAAGSNGDAAASRRKKSRWGPPSASATTMTTSAAAAAAGAAADADRGASSSSSEVAQTAAAANEAAAAAAPGNNTSGSQSQAQSKTKPNSNTAAAAAAAATNGRPNRWGSPLSSVGPHVLGPPPFGLPPPGHPGFSGRPPPPPPPGHPAHAAHAHAAAHAAAAAHAHAHAQAHAQAHGLPPPMYYGGGPYHPVGYQQQSASGSGSGSSSASSSASGKGGKGKSKKATPAKSGKSKTKSKSKTTSKAKASSSSKAKSTTTTTKTKAKAKRPRSRSSSASASASASASPAQHAQPPPPVVGPPHGYGPVGPPPLPYHEAQLLSLTCGGGPPVSSMQGMPPSMQMSDLPASCGDNRTLEWEAHAEALALGLGLLDDEADDPTCSTTAGGSHPHDAYLQHGPPPAAAAAAEEEADADAEAGAGTDAGTDAEDDAEDDAKEEEEKVQGTGSSNGEGMDADVDGDMDADEPAENDDDGTKGRSARPAAAAHEDGESVAPIDDSGLGPILTLQGYRPRTSKAAAAGNDVREQFAKTRECRNSDAAAGSSGAATSQEREERRRVQLRERLGRRRTVADGDDQDREFRQDLAGVWYPRCSWIAAADDGAGADATCADGAVGPGKSAGAAAVVDPSPPMIRRRRRRQSQSSASAPSADPAQGRKRSRPAGSVSFSLGNANGGVSGTGQETPKQLQQQVLQSLPSSSNLLSDAAYIDLVCGSAAKGEACTSLLASLLDAMGMELQTKQRKGPVGRASTSSGVSASVDSHARPMREGKKPVQTPGTVREFAATLISMGLQQAAPLATTSTDKQFTVLDEVAAAFRLACHYVLRYVASALANTNSSRDNKSPVRRKKATKVSEFARRAYMTLFVTLRGLIVRIVDQPDSADSTDVDGAILSFFATPNSSRENSDGEASPSFSPLERLLLDVIPLLTCFVQPPLHDKHSTSLMSNLLLLDESTRMKKSKRTKDPTRRGSIIIVRDGLMELFVRQLVDQEDLTERRLRKLLNVSSTHLSDISGAAASLHPKPSSECIMASDGIVEYRRQQQRELEEIARQEASTTSISTLASAMAARSVSSSWDTEDASRSGATASASVADSDNDLRLVRIDGCIYLSKIISRLLDSRPSKSSSASPPSSGQASNKTDSSTNEDDGAGRPKSSSGSSASSNFAASSELKINASEEKVRVHDTEKIEGVAQTAYFLFHTLVESHDVIGSFPRKNVSSAVLACFLLAGKMEDCPLKLRTILRITKNATLPPPPFETVRQCYDKLAPNAPEVLPMKWGEPSAELIKQFEFSLLTTLGFVMPEDPQSLHPTASIIEIKNKLDLDSDTMKHIHRLMKDPCYTHSSLCLLREPQLMAAALYYLSCQKGRVELLKDWDLVLEEEAVVIKVVADYSRWVGHCVKHRERQWNVFKTLKYRVNTKTTGSRATSDSRGSTPDTTVDDSLAVWSRTIPPISEFEAPPLLPTELSTVTEKINGLLSDPNPEESSSPDEVQDEDYLTLAALLEIPDDAVEDSDTSPSANSVDSIAVLMDSHSKETSTTCSKDDGANGGDGDVSKQTGSSETTMVVSPALGDDRHDTMLSEGDANADAVSETAARAERPVESQGSVESNADGATVDQASSATNGADMASTVPFSPIRRKSISLNPSASESEGPVQEQKVDVEVPVLVEASETRKQGTNADPVSSPVLAARPAPALPPAPTSPKKKLLMKAAEDEAAAEAEAQSAASAGKDGTGTINTSSKATKPADNGKLPPNVLSPELSTKKRNSTLKAALTPRRAAAASSLLELKIASKLASTVESISREGSPVPPSKEDTPKTSRRATRSAVKAGKSPQPDAKGLVRKSAKKKALASTSRKRRAASKTSSDVIENASEPLEKEDKKKGGTKSASSRQSEDSVPTRPLKKRALSTSEEPAVPIDSEKFSTEEGTVAPESSKAGDVPLPQATGTTPSWYPAPNLERLEAQAKGKGKGRGKKRAAQEVSAGTSDTPSQEKSTARSTTAAKRRKSPRTKTIPIPEDVPKDDDDNFPIASDIDNGEDDTLPLDQEAERNAKARARYDFSTANLKKTAPLYKNDLFRLEDENEQPLICELASLHREAAIHFIDTMKRKLDGFWLNESVATRAAEAFWFQLPPRVQTEEARHLYRNFADSLDDLRDALPLETPDKPLRLRLSRREVDIMLYFISKGQTAMDCHYLMPYRSRRKMREVYKSIRMLIGDVKEEYMANVNITVEALIAIEGSGSRREDTQNVIMLC